MSAHSWEKIEHPVGPSMEMRVGDFLRDVGAGLAEDGSHVFFIRGEVQDYGEFALAVSFNEYAQRLAEILRAPKGETP